VAELSNVGSANAISQQGVLATPEASPKSGSKRVHEEDQSSPRRAPKRNATQNVAQSNYDEWIKDEEFDAGIKEGAEFASDEEYSPGDENTEEFGHHKGGIVN
jgi:hypothetical protein